MMNETSWPHRQGDNKQKMRNNLNKFKHLCDRNK